MDTIQTDITSHTVSLINLQDQFADLQAAMWNTTGLGARLAAVNIEIEDVRATVGRRIDLTHERCGCVESETRKLWEASEEAEEALQVFKTDLKGWVNSWVATVEHELEEVNSAREGTTSQADSDATQVFAALEATTGHSSMRQQLITELFKPA